MSNKVLARIFRCRFCGHDTEFRYLLRDHLMSIHGFGKRNATQESYDSEWRLIPSYVPRDEFVEVEDEY